MSKKKIEDLLKNTPLPGEINQEHKQNLKRDLLNSKNFEKRSLFSKLFAKRNIIGFAFTIFVGFIITMMLIRDDSVKVPELTNLTSTNYASFFSPSNYASFDNDLTIFGKDNNKINLKVEQIADLTSSNYHIIVRDDNNKEILDRIIIKGDDIFRKENPLIQSVGTKTITYTQKIDSFILSDSLNIPEEITKITLNKIEEAHEPLLDLKSGYVIYKMPSSSKGEIPTSKDETFLQEVPREVDLDEYFGANPADLSRELENSDSVKFLRKDFDPVTDEELQVVQISKEIDAASIKAFFIKVDDLRFDSLTSDSPQLEKNHFNWGLDDSLTLIYNLDPDSLLKKIDSSTDYQKLKTITISSESGTIRKVRISIKRGSQKVDLSEIKFNSQKIIEKDESYFNPQKFNLIFKGK